jgi:opacity protein-like surface antigen
MEEIMRKLLVLFGFALLATTCAQAQETRSMEVSGQWDFVRTPGTPSTNCQGAGGTFGVNVNRWLGIIGDFDACKVTGLPSGTSSHSISYLFGPRLAYHNSGRLTPYVQVLLGGDRASATVTGFPSSSANSFAMTFGGGADIQLTHHLAFRALQAEYFYTRFGGVRQNNLRLQSGIVYRFSK